MEGKCLPGMQKTFVRDGGARLVNRLSVLLLTFFTSAMAQAYVLTINGADNKIILEGTLTATVTHTAEGLALTIPGVDITLDCEGASSTESCTVAIGAGTASGAGSTTSGTGSTTSGTGGTDSGTGSTTSGTGSTDSGTGGTDSGTGGTDSGTGGTDSGTGGSSSEDYCKENPIGYGCGSAYQGSSGSRDSSGSGNSGGYVVDESDTSSSSSSSSSSGGYVVSADDNLPAVDNSVAFRQGGERLINDKSGQLDYGSAGAQANQRSAKTVIDKGWVLALGFSMGNEASQSGRVAFVPTSNPPEGADLRLWISGSVDGPRVSEGCSYVGYSEGNLGISVGGGEDCDLSAGGDYFLNIAACVSGLDDYQCKSTSARTQQQDSGSIFLKTDF